MGVSELPPSTFDNEKVPIVTEKDDIGLQFLAAHANVSYTPAEDRQVRAKIDLHLMPIVSPLLSDISIAPLKK